MMRKTVFIYQKPGWPVFDWNAKKLAGLLAAVRHKQGRLLGRMESLGFVLKAEATLQTLTEDVLKTSEIEGEILDRDQVRSSIARHLGMDIGGLTPSDRNVEGVVAMSLDAAGNFREKVTADRLFGWHAALFPTGRSGLRKISVGAWRTEAAGPMQVVSGPLGREHVHFEAPPASSLKNEMRSFLHWLNTETDIDPVVKAGLAHLWFVTIHPFEDGNGRIARAIADLMLARADESPQRFYSMSSQIRKERGAYYQILERTQKGEIDVSDWLEWFLRCLDGAIDGAGNTLGAVLAKARFWETQADQSFNDRQRMVLNRLLDGFVGKLTSSKYAKLAKCSQATASRDIDELISNGILLKNAAGGRSTNYQIRLE